MCLSMRDLLRKAPIEGQRPGPFYNEALTALRLDDHPPGAAPHFEGLELLLIGAATILFGIAAYLWI